MKRRSTVSAAAITVSAAVVCFIGLTDASHATEAVPVGHLATLSGPTSSIFSALW